MRSSKIHEIPDETRTTLTWAQILMWSAALFGLASFFGILMGASQLLDAQAALRGWWSEFFWWVAWGFIFPVLVWAAWHFRFDQGQIFRSLAKHLVLLALLAPCHQAAVVVMWNLSHPQGPGSWSTFFRHFVHDMAQHPSVIPIQMLRFTLWYVVFVAMVYTFYFRKALREKEHQALRLQSLVALAELKSLKMQLHPHFLFNSLNALTALIRRKPEEAERMVGLLGDLLRRSLRESALQEVTLGQELDFMNLYLEIEQIRFGGRLAWSIEVEKCLQRAMVPHLILQPLVENAVRHGIAPKTEGGRILVHAELQADQLHLCIEDDGVGLAPRRREETGEGIGLSNATERLQQLYGDRAHLTQGPRAEGGFRVELRIPFHTPSDGMM